MMNIYQQLRLHKKMALKATAFLLVPTCLIFLNSLSHPFTIMSFRGENAEQVDSHQEDHEEMVIEKIEQKKILFYHTNKKLWVNEGSEFAELKCLLNLSSIRTCLIYENKSSLPIDEYDGILFRDYTVDLEELIPRSPKQRYVLWELESPSNLRKRHGTLGNDIGFKDFFNWTMTYRTESDIVCKRKKLIRKSRPEIYPDLDIAKQKSGFAAWIVSHCNAISGRDALANEMRKYIPVDIYGKCGNLSCPNENGTKSRECLEYIDNKYKFYFSFENSLCKEYATEKFFEHLGKNILPIVYGLADYATEAPPYSYIDVNKFKNVKDLTDYLLYLDKNDTAYNEYFRWTQEFTLGKADNYWCSLCEKLYTDTEPKVYNNMADWYISQAKCVEPMDGEYYWQN